MATATIAVAVMIGAIWLSRFGALSLCMGLVVLTMGLFPRTLLGASPMDNGRSGIAGYDPRLMSYTICVLVIVGLALLRRRADAMWLLTLPFLIYLVLWVSFVWQANSSIWAGTIHLAVGAAGWLAGRYMGSIAGDSQGSRTVARWLLFLVLVQLTVVILQSVGLPVFPQSAGSELYEGGRANGTFGHPSTLGKVLVIAVMMLLPVTQSSDVTARKLAWVAVMLSVPAVILTESRSNFAAIALLVVTWVVLLPFTANMGKKVGVVAGVVIALAASSSIWIERFATGEDGTFRARYSLVASDVIARFPLSGTAPNQYVEVAGQFDAMTVLGWPVHNAFLLAAAELGVAGALLLFMPMFVTYLRAVSRFFGRRGSGSDRSLIASIGPILAIALTGWGLMNDTMPLWFLAVGFLSTYVPAKADPTIPSWPAERSVGSGEMGSRALAT